LCVDDTGTGKTIQALALVAAQIETRKHTLIVVKRGNMETWIEAIQKFTPCLKVMERKIFNAQLHICIKNTDCFEGMGKSTHIALVSYDLYYSLNLTSLDWPGVSKIFHNSKKGESQSSKSDGIA
jgi:SNF2 family DNA or RNA helicase